MRAKQRTWRCWDQLYTFCGGWENCTVRKWRLRFVCKICLLNNELGILSLKAAWVEVFWMCSEQDFLQGRSQLLCVVLRAKSWLMQQCLPSAAWFCPWMVSKRPHIYVKIIVFGFFCFRIVLMTAGNRIFFFLPKMVDARARGDSVVGKLLAV